MVKSGAISIGELSSFLMYTVFAGSSLFGLSSFYSELMKGVGAASRLFELQDRHPTISPTVGNPVKSARGPIRFENLSFAYPTRPAVDIFNGLDFEIPQGTNVAIVGPSGGGKSTIASLMLRFYTPTQGTIKIDGVDISTMNVKTLRRKIGLVAQEPVLFSGTIAENIAYGKPKASQGEINAAARKANCRFIEDFPDGLSTFVGARGAQLSGGQKQRIAIARALVKNPDILILDEGRFLSSLPFPQPYSIIFITIQSLTVTQSHVGPGRRIRNPRQQRPGRPLGRKQHHHQHRPPPLDHQTLRHHHRALVRRQSRRAGQLPRIEQQPGRRLHQIDGVADDGERYAATTTAAATAGDGGSEGRRGIDARRRGRRRFRRRRRGKKGGCKGREARGYREGIGEDGAWVEGELRAPSPKKVTWWKHMAWHGIRVECVGFIA